MAGSKAQEPASLVQMIDNLSPEAWYQSPGGRRTLLLLAMAAGVPKGARVLDVQCGIGSGSIDLAELYEAKVTAFDDYPPYLAFGRQQAGSRGVGKRTTFQAVAGNEAASVIPADSFDVVLGLGGGLSDTLPGGLAGGLAAAATWLVDDGILILGDLVTPGPTSDLMRHVFGESLISEQRYFSELENAGFDVILAFRSSSNDWDQMAETMQKLRERKLDLGTEDERQRQKLTTAARSHPELAYLNVAARKAK
ncbi:MAG: methyltransferase domain-containing protein [Microthrixaceae bacterium]|nr:methyltransferase domain-containing protein [Microthrixaceae bacterium]